MSFAKFISRLFDPVVVFIFILLIGAWVSGLTGFLLFRFIAFSLFGIILPPAALLFWAVKTKHISDWDISRRAERIKPFIVLSLFILIDYFLIGFIGNKILIQEFITIVVWFSGFFLITLFWKISGHTAAISLLIGLIIHWFGLGYWYLLILILFIAWSRIKTHNHTLMQVIAGGCYSLIIVYYMSLLLR
jgi:membrane-associated phospholipid phosphatase